MANKAVAAKIIEAWKLIGSIEKKGRNPKFNYAFVREEDAADALRNAFIKVGLSCVPSVEKIDRSTIKTNSGGDMQHVIITMKFTLTDKDTGESDSFVMVGEAADSFDKATYKAITGCTKYAYTKLAMSGAEDNEDDEIREEKTSKDRDEAKPVPSGASYRKPAEEPKQKPATDSGKAASSRPDPNVGGSSKVDKPLSSEHKPSTPNNSTDADDSNETATTEDVGMITAVIPAMKGKPATMSFKPDSGAPVYGVTFDSKKVDVPSMLKLHQNKAKVRIICDITQGPTPFLMNVVGV